MLRLDVNRNVGRRMSLLLRGLHVEDDYLVGFAAGLASSNLYHPLKFEGMVLADWAINKAASRNRFFLFDGLHRWSASSHTQRT